MKRVSRAQLRGEPLDPLCKKAHTTTGEYGPDDKRVFCFGFVDAMTDEPEEKCVECRAFVRNEKSCSGLPALGGGISGREKRNNMTKTLGDIMGAGVQLDTAGKKQSEYLPLAELLKGGGD